MANVIKVAPDDTILFTIRDKVGPHKKFIEKNVWRANIDV